jgi:hypothetical protein
MQEAIPIEDLLNGQSSSGFWDKEKSFALYVESLDDKVKN